MNYKKEIEYQYPEYQNLMEIHDTAIFSPSISFESHHTVFVANHNNNGVIILGVRQGEGYLNKQELDYLQTWEEEGEIKADWHSEGEIEGR